MFSKLIASTVALLALTVCVAPAYAASDRPETGSVVVPQLGGGTQHLSDPEKDTPLCC